MEPSGDALTAQLRKVAEAQGRIQDEAAREAEARPAEPEPPSSTPPPQPEPEPEP